MGTKSVNWAKALILLGVSFWAQSAFGQGAFIPPRVVTSTVSGITRPIPGATITVCAGGALGIPCSPALAGGLFKDAALTQPLANPTTTDTNGNYPNMAVAGGTYTITESASGFTGFSYQVSVACPPAGACTVSSLISNGPATFNAGIATTTTNSTGAGVHSGTETFTGNIIVSTLNGQPVVGGSLYPCTAAGHLAAIAALASTGGKVDATACTGAINFTATVNYGAVNQPIALWLGAVAITFTNTSGNGFQVNGRGCTLQGLGFLNTNILGGSGFTGDLIRVEPLSGSNSVDGVTVRGMRLDGNLAPSVKLLNLLSVREPSVVESMQLRTFTATALNVGKSAIGGAGISQNISFSNVNLEPTVPATVTADAATIACDGCNFNNNFTIVNGNNPIAAGFHAVTVNATASGDGRANTFMGGSLAGYDTELFATGVGAGTQGLRVIGTRFENFNTAITLTGPSASFPTTHSFIAGNYYLVGIGTGAKYVNLDFAQANTVIEDMNAGVVGAITLTANSLNNQIFVRANALTDISDAGAGNSVYAMTNSGGIGQTNLIGQTVIARGNTQAVQWSFLDSNSLTGSATSGVVVGNKGVTLIEGTASSGSAGNDVLYGEVITHTPSWNNNNNGVSSPTGAWQCTNVTPVTVNANVATDQNLMACTIPAGTLNRVGRSLQINIAGVYSTVAASTASLTYKVKLCTVSGCGSGTVITLLNIATGTTGALTAANFPFHINGQSTTQTAGASSAYEAHGRLTIDITSALAADSVFADSNTATVGTIDDTAQLFFQVTAASASASASNSWTQRQLIIQTIN